ncbi:MAG TPA: hypothetical protein VE955_02120 [Candidatus Dormibacteraeota bacterium]|nr:hypothetical protein [Candidatus Dormibacteraeota bacterium]
MVSDIDRVHRLDGSSFLLRAPHPQAFKTNVAARAWTYISMGSVAFAIGLVLFTLEAVQPMGLLPAGGIVMAVGAAFLVMGLRKNYLFWASKGHFE